MKINGTSLEIGGLSITFHRTLRLPEDGKTHNLPPNLGAFPLARVDDYKDKVPASWREHGGVFFPLYQREAMWLSFHNMNACRAIKVAAGKVNAVSGTPWSETLTKLTPASREDPAQDYMVAPPQPWLDGFNVGDGVIRQFVAMPLGMGYTVEAQVTGEEKFGGLQLLVIEPKIGGPADVAPRGPLRRSLGGSLGGGGGIKGMTFGGGAVGMSVGAYAEPGVYCSDVTNGVDTEELGVSVSDFGSAMPASASPVSSMDSMTLNAVKGRTKGLKSERKRSAEMGLAQGGKMKQAIYADPYGVDAWNTDRTERVFVHIVNSEMWREITGKEAPATPVSAQEYAKHGYPWFDIYDEGVPAVDGSSTLKSAKTVGELDKQHGFEGQQDDSPISEKNVTTYKIDAPKNEVRDGKW